MKALVQTNFPNLMLQNRGKVRDIYDLGDHLLLVASDRISAFDVIMAESVPGKGKILTKISLFWFNCLKDICPNHLISADPHQYPDECRPYIGDLVGRSMLVKKCKVIPIECIVRGYLAGSGWAEYQKTGEIKGNKLPSGLVESSRLPLPIFTPSTKAELGAHDENISFTRMSEIIGADLALTLREMSLALYTKAADYAAPRGITLADTKFEFGLADRELLLIDELLTPDSSRFWPADDYEPGRPQKSFDKQYLRDYLDSLVPRWNKKPPPPPLPQEVINNTFAAYNTALYKLTKTH